MSCDPRRTSHVGLRRAVIRFVKSNAIRLGSSWVTLPSGRNTHQVLRIVLCNPSFPHWPLAM